VYTSQDPNVRVAIVIFQGRHSHPPWPEEKPNHDAKADLAKCVEGFGVLDATGGRINNCEFVDSMPRLALGSVLSYLNSQLELRTH
jgi:hypothetical protein